MDPVIYVAPAKLTLELGITGVRNDGYHLIDAEMVALDFGDQLLIQEAGTDVRGPTRLTVNSGGSDTQGSPDDLVLRALALADRLANVHLTKRVPPGAGLGGGSADAAAVLRWAGYSDLEGAATLGADVPFCLVGGRARVRGIGELVEPLPFKPMTITLLTPPIHCSTPLVFNHWDEMGSPVGTNGNDLEPSALKLFPELARWRDELGEASGAQPKLAGSGSTWWVEANCPGPGRIVASTIPAHDGS